MTLHISEAEVRAVLPCRWPWKPSKRFLASKPLVKSSFTPRRRFELPGGGFFHYRPRRISPWASLP